MKRLFLVLIVMTLAVGIAFTQTNGQGNNQPVKLIDFAELIADFPADTPVNHEDTLLDFSRVAGSSFTIEQLDEMKTSLYLRNWEVDLASSSQFVETVGNSMVMPAPVNQNARRYAGETVLGVRVMFPTEPYNSWAVVRPPFEIPAYADPTRPVEETVQNDAGEDVQVTSLQVVPREELPLEAEDGTERGLGDKFLGYGVVKNVGVLKSVRVNVNGLNFPHGFSIILRDENNRDHEIFMGYLNFDGWRTLQWDNPNYIEEVRNRELQRFPQYPNLSPLRKLIGLRIYRDASMVGGDFVTYVKDIYVTYDQAVLDLDRDIDDEAVWGILTEREQARRQAELRRLGDLQVLRYLERLKIYEEPEDNGEGNGNGTDDNG